MDFGGEGLVLRDAGDEEGCFVEVAGVGAGELPFYEAVGLGGGEVDVAFVVVGEVRDGVVD